VTDALDAAADTVQSTAEVEAVADQHEDYPEHREF
jgi:hypothetical protein